MKRAIVSGSLMLLVMVTCMPSHAAPVVVAGTDTTAPPAYWENSFWGVTTTVERAMLFTITPGQPVELTELQVAAFHYEGLAGNQATFTVREDTAGIPGAEVARFEVAGISPTEQVLSALPEGPAMLLPNTKYWLHTQNPQGQVNWNLGDGAFGVTAYRVSGEDWIVLDSANVSAFALLGTVVPEPSGCVLLATALLTLVTRRRVA